MTNRTATKRVVKNIEKPKSERRKCEVIKHFDPSLSYAACRTNIKVEIPLINVDVDEPKAVSKVPRTPRSRKSSHIPTKCTKRQQTLKTPSSNENTLTHLIRNKNVRDVKGQYQFKIERESVKRPTKSNKSSSSSSLETALQKFTNKCQVRSKSFPSNRSRNPVQDQKNLKSAREKSSTSRSRDESLRSATDPSLLQKKLNLRALQQEIQQNKKITKPHASSQAYKTYKNSPKVQGLKSEILQSKTDSSLQRKILITELRSEIAQYKELNHFYVYNTYDDELGPKRESGATNNTPQKFGTRSSSVPKRDSISSERDDTNYGSAFRGLDLDESKESSREASKAGQKRVSIVSRDDLSLFNELDLNESKESNVEPSRTDKEATSASLADTRPSESTSEERCRPFTKRIDQPEPETLNDELIRNKILEANQLIDRVKKALGKIKAIQSGSQSEDGESPVSKTTSTDIEETIKNLKKETAKLITDDNEDVFFQGYTVIAEPQPVSCFPTTSKRSSKREGTNATLNRTFSREDKARKCTGCAFENEVVPTFEDLEDDRKRPSDNCCEQYLRGREDMDFDRPKTRRNEADEELAEQFRRDKFRSRPESDRLEISSSLEELQAKLQTITETTESTYSTPRKQSSDLTGDSNGKYSSADPPNTENKEIQVAPDQSTTEVDCICPLRDDQCIQACANRTLTIKNTNIESISPRRAPLEAKNFSPQEVPPMERKRTSCREENLPIVELLPAPPRQNICEKCQRNLKEEHLGGVTIPSNLQKLAKLKIQVLPPIIIQQAMTVTQVLNFSISPEGECENLVKDAQNIMFVDARSSRDSEKPFYGIDELIDDALVIVHNPSSNVMDDISNLHFEDSMLDSMLAKSEQFEDNNNNNNEDSREDVAVLKETNNDYDFVESRERYSKKQKDCEPKPRKLTAEEEEETNKKMLWYKSYHIYDNPNQHDPGQLDEESIEKVSQIDFQFYKTFINPNPALSEEHFTPNVSRISSVARNKISGFESKTVQCDESMLGFEDWSLNKDDPARKLNFLLSASPKNGEQQPQLPSDEFDSRVTVLHVKATKPPMNGAQSSVLFRGRQITSETQDLLPDSDYSPSEITVTVSYSSSSDQGSNHVRDSKRSIAEFHESEIKTIDLDSNSNSNSLTYPADKIKDKIEVEKKTLAVADKAVILKLQEKLKCIDTNDAQPMYTVTKDSANCDTIDNFLRGLTTFHEKEREPSRAPPLPRITEAEISQSVNTRQSTEEPSQDNTFTDYTDFKQSDESNEHKTKPSCEKNHTVNYLFNNNELTTFENSYTKHLELGKSGRYRDEEHLFTQLPYPTIANSCHKMEVLPYNMMGVKDIIKPLPQPPPFEHKDKEIGRDKFQMIPRYRLRRYSPDTSNSDTVTTNSISEGEILCKHSVSNGEIHVCRHRPQCPRLPRNILTRRNFMFPHTNRSLHPTIPRDAPKKFDLNDPKITIEHRRNYFNNWVTYYVRPQDVYASSTSSGSHNKQ